MPSSLRHFCAELGFIETHSAFKNAWASSERPSEFRDLQFCSYFDWIQGPDSRIKVNRVNSPSSGLFLHKHDSLQVFFSIRYQLIGSELFSVCKTVRGEAVNGPRHWEALHLLNYDS